MADRTKTGTIDYGDGQDSVTVGVEILDAERDLIYAGLNAVAKLQAVVDESTVVGPATHEVRLVTGGPAIKYWNGSSWVTVASPAGYGSGLTLDAAAVGFSQGMFPKRISTTNVQVSASATAPATIEVGGELLQNTTDTTLYTGHTFSGAAAGIYYLYVEKSGATTNWIMKRAATPFTPSATQRVISWVYYTGSDFIEITSDEVMTRESVRNLRVVFHSYLSNAAGTFTAGVWATLACDVHTINSFGTLSSGVFTAPCEGYYDFGVTGSIVPNSAGADISVRLLKNGDTGSPLAMRITLGHPRAVQHQVELTTPPIYLAAGETVTAQAAASATVTNYTATPYDNAFWGRWLGRRCA